MEIHALASPIAIDTIMIPPMWRGEERGASSGVSDCTAQHSGKYSARARRNPAPVIANDC